MKRAGGLKEQLNEEGFWGYTGAKLCELKVSIELSSSVAVAVDHEGLC